MDVTLVGHVIPGSHAISGFLRLRPLLIPQFLWLWASLSLYCSSAYSLATCA